MTEHQGLGLLTREERIRTERIILAPWACQTGQSRGRLVEEANHPIRTAFQRDRDRVVHSTAFRRLQYKTQVFVHHEGDHFRNRLTHTLEGAQIARTIARALRLNEDLAEAIALAHDLGHTPFGHAGERVLAKLLSGDGGFDHNRQSLRVVDVLEVRDPSAPGLNLSEETREGILKHGCHWDHPVRLPALDASRSMEAQVADASDEIAYVNHDLDDALRAELLDFQMLMELPLVSEVTRAVHDAYPGISDPIRRGRVVASLIDRLVTDLLRQTIQNLEEAGIQSPESVRAHPTKLVGLSVDVDRGRRELKAFLFEHFYNHPSVTRRTQKAEEIVEQLFLAFADNPELLPSRIRKRFDHETEKRVIADYVAGMTDRFAVAEHQKLLGSEEDPILSS
ncbi:MAG: deoxyguanosinetriphosphate triphosphohydrolase [Myxococcota bacterium]|nr:deoxyguanosinetriphosphate triphosphohydrolase [Myxococcota bacterium]